MKEEKIICECLNELTITETTTCPQCKRIIHTSKELREMQFVLDSQIATLKVQSQRIAIELSLRSMRRPSRPYLIKQDFYKGLRGKSNPVTKKERSKQELNAEAMSLLQQV